MQTLGSLLPNGVPQGSKIQVLLAKSANEKEILLISEAAKNEGDARSSHLTSFTNQLLDTYFRKALAAESDPKP